MEEKTRKGDILALQLQRERHILGMDVVEGGGGSGPNNQGSSKI